MKYIIAIICFISCAAVQAQTTKLLSTKDKDTLNHRIDSLKNRIDTLHIPGVTAVDAIRLQSKDSSYYLDYNNLHNKPVSTGGGTVDLSNYYNKQGVDTAKDNLRALITAKPDSIDLIIDNATIIGSGTDADPLRVNPSFAGVGGGITAVTVNTGKQIQFFENADGSISIQAVSQPSTPNNTIKTTQGDVIKTTQGDIIIFN